MRAVAIAAALAVAGAGVVVTRVVWEGQSALAAGERARARGDADAAIERYRRAARWYLPGAPHVRRAYERLEAIARTAEAEGDAGTALAAWRGMRSSILATRSAYVPFEERLEVASVRVAELMAAAEGQGVSPGADEAERAAWHRERLERIDAPSAGWTLAAVFGLALWLSGGALFATRGVTADERLAARPAAMAGILAAAGLLLWVVGLAGA